MARNIFVISDTHFHHKNIIQYCNRPFKDTYEMDEFMIQQWNKTVSNQDIIYHLGDVYIGKYKDEPNMLFKRLNGAKRLILGNHDNGKDQNLLRYFEKIMMWRMFPEFKVLLTHVPVHESSINRDKIRWNVHGHIHNKESPPGPYKNVSVEVINYTPVAIEEFRE